MIAPQVTSVPVSRERWKVRLKRSKGKPRTELEWFMLWKRLPPRVRRKGPNPWGIRWRVWMEEGWRIDGLAKAHGAGDWAWRVTLTQRCTQTDGERSGLGERAIQRYGDELAREADDHPLVVYGFERTMAGDRHVEALIAFPGAGRAPSTRSGEWHWRANGHARVRRYKPSIGGAWYISKDGNTGETFGCPRKNACRRRGGCRLRSHRLQPRLT